MDVPRVRFLLRSLGSSPLFTAVVLYSLLSKV
jgi:hypothetical protein